MSKELPEKYSLEQAAEEAEEINEKIKSGGATDYREAEKIVDKERFDSFLEHIPSKDMQSVISAHEEQINPLLVHEDIAERLEKATKVYQKLDRETSVDEENIYRYLHENTTKSITSLDRQHINALRLNELLDAILSSPGKDLRDLDFAFHVIDTESNKYVRNLALKKTVDIIRNLPKDLPSLTSLYEEMGVRIPKRDFLFSLPLLMENGEIKEELLNTATRYHQNTRLRTGSAKEATYFTALVDLYEPEYQNDMPQILKTLNKDYAFTDSKYAKILKDKNEQRKTQGLPPLEQRTMDLGELKQTYEAMKLRVIKQTMPDVYTDLQKLPVEKREGVESRQEFIDSYFSDIWENLSRDEKRKFWDEELYDTAQGLMAADVNTDASFEEVLKKLSAVKLASPHHLKDLLRTPYHGMEELNKKTDQVQMDLFRENFEFTGYDKQVLTEISDLPKDASLKSEEAHIPERYREFGNFNVFLILLDRYRSGPYDKLKPRLFRENVVPLLKEVAYHVMKGDFKEWRAGITKSIQDAPLEYRASDKAFWDTWHQDAETHNFKTQMSFNLRETIEGKGSAMRSVLARPEQYLLQPTLWKNSAMKEIVGGIVRSKADATASAEKILSGIKNKDASVLEQYKLNPKDQANLKVMEKMLTAFIASMKLSDTLKGDLTIDTQQKRLALQGLLKTMQIDTFLDRPKNPKRKGEQDAELGFRLLKLLEESLAAMHIIEQRRAKGEVSVVDSSDPQDLLTIGQRSHNLINCMSYEGDPNRNAYIMDIATSKNKKMIMVKERDRVVTRAVTKILRTEAAPNAEPIVIIDDVLAEREIYDYKGEIIEHLKRKFADMSNVIIGEGIPDPDRKLEHLQKVKKEIEDGTTAFNTLSPEEQQEITEFQKNILLGWGTGSRVSGELVETAPPGMPPHPALYAEPINPRTRKLRTAFYRHFVKRFP